MPDPVSPLHIKTIGLKIEQNTMAIKITVSDKVGFIVEGTTNDADANEEKFEFTLTAKRLGEDAVSDLQISMVQDATKTGNHVGLTARLAELITNWTGVRDETDAPVAYSQDAFKSLCKANHGLALVIWRAYLANVGAKAKN